jgi:nitroimidazol reductase NimA-like FMN-containing flavoprotein (pyridoxamine 5'-phosphate oxidase superfamily)
MNVGSTYPTPLIHRLSEGEIAELLALDVPAHLATVDPQGFPRITPIWFLWENGTFYMTSVKGKPHLRNLERNPKASVCVDIEECLTDGQRPSRQVKAYGEARLADDTGGRRQSNVP